MGQTGRGGCRESWSIGGGPWVADSVGFIVPKVDIDALHTTVESAGLFKQWRMHSGIIRQKVGISGGFQGWSKDSGARLVGLDLNARTVDCVDVACADRLHSFPSGTPKGVLTKDFWCNPSQGIQRKPWGDKGTLTGNGMWYSYEHDTTLDGTDFLRLHGMPELMNLQALSHSEIKDLGGEAFSVPISTMFAASFYYLPWGSWWSV